MTALFSSLNRSEECRGAWIRYLCGGCEDERKQLGKTSCNNVFQRVDGQWFICVQHASRIYDPNVFFFIVLLLFREIS